MLRRPSAGNEAADALAGRQDLACLWRDPDPRPWRAKGVRLTAGRAPRAARPRSRCFRGWWTSIATCSEAAGLRLRRAAGRADGYGLCVVAEQALTDARVAELVGDCLLALRVQLRRLLLDHARGFLHGRVLAHPPHIADQLVVRLATRS